MRKILLILLTSVICTGCGLNVHKDASAEDSYINNVTSAEYQIWSADMKPSVYFSNRPETEFDHSGGSFEDPAESPYDHVSYYTDSIDQLIEAGLLPMLDTYHEVDWFNHQHWYAYDADGRVLQDAVTYTMRDDILITASESPEGRKTFTWKSDQGWYQIRGDASTSYENMVYLLDWFWIHPIDQLDLG